MTNDDKLHGNEGNDYLQGDTGSDSLYGNEDNDILVGNEGRDRFFCGSGDDKILDFDYPLDVKLSDVRNFNILCYLFCKNRSIWISINP